MKRVADSAPIRGTFLAKIDKVLKTEKKTIGGQEFQVTQLGAIKGRQVLMRLLKIVGPAAGALTGESLGPALAKLAETLSEADLEYLCDVFGEMSTVHVGGNKNPLVRDQFDLLFAGKYENLVQWLRFCLEVNFSGFFGALKKSVPSTSPAAAETAS